MDRKQTQRMPAATRLQCRAPQTQLVLYALLPGNFRLQGIQKNNFKAARPKPEAKI